MVSREYPRRPDPPSISHHVGNGWRPPLPGVGSWSSKARTPRVEPSHLGAVRPSRQVEAGGRLSHASPPRLFFSSVTRAKGPPGLPAPRSDHRRGRVGRAMVLDGCSRFRGAVPLAQQDGGVVTEVAVVMLEHGPHQTAQGFRGRKTVGLVAEDEVDETVTAELTPFRVTGLDDAVGVEQQLVAGLQVLAAQDRGKAEVGAERV